MEITEGALFEIASEKLRVSGYILSKMFWNADSVVMNINYSHNGMTMTLMVNGLPEDIPTDVFKGFIDHFIKTEIRGMKKVTVDKNVAAWLTKARASRKIRV